MPTLNERQVETLREWLKTETDRSFQQESGVRILSPAVADGWKGRALGLHHALGFLDDLLSEEDE